MATGEEITRQATCIEIDGRGVLIEGAPGSGKTSLALELIDRGARLVGDDGVLLRAEGSRLIASPHPRTRGLIEVRNLGILKFPCTEGVALALALTLDAKAPRFVEEAGALEIAGIALPHLQIWPEGGPLAIKAELALRHFGLHF